MNFKPTKENNNNVIIKDSKVNKQILQLTQTHARVEHEPVI